MVKGGRRFSFAAMVVVGDGKGKVGWGYGKANEVPPSVEKAVKDGMRQHDRRAAAKAARFRTRSKATSARPRWCSLPAGPGTGVIAGAAVRAVCEAAGIHDILTKSFGSNNPVNAGQGDASTALTAAAAPSNEVERLRGVHAVMNLNDVHRGIKKHKKRKRARPRHRLRPRQDGRPRPQGPEARAPAASCDPVFEGGSMPLVRRSPQARLQQHAGRMPIAVVNVGDSGRSASTPATKSRPRRSARPRTWPRAGSTMLKILGDGELTKKLKVSAHRFSESAAEKIEKAGGEGRRAPRPSAGGAKIRRRQAPVD